MTHQKEIIKIIKEEDNKYNEKKLKKNNNNISSDKHLLLKLSEFDKVPISSNRRNSNIKINNNNVDKKIVYNDKKRSFNNLFPVSNKNGLLKLKTLNNNQNKITLHNDIKYDFNTKMNKNKYSIDKIYKNENKEATNGNKEILNSIKKFKIVYNTDKKLDNPKIITENINNEQIRNSKKITNSELKSPKKLKNTFLGKPLFLNKLLSINSNEKRISQKSSNNLKKNSIKKNSNNKCQETYISNRKNKNKNFSTKNIQLKKVSDGKPLFTRNCYISNQNIIKVDLSKKDFNFDENCEQKKNNKKKKKGFFFDFDKELKLKRPTKRNYMFQSLISLDKKNIFNYEHKKKPKKKVSKKRYDSFDSLISQIFNMSNSYRNIKENNNNNAKSESFFSSNSKNNKDDNKKDNLKFQQYKMKHINSICLGRYLNKMSDKNNQIIKVPAFSVVKPDKLISFEFNREYETRNRSYYMNNKEIIDDETNIKENSKERRDISQNIKKRSKIFCCL